MLHSRTRLHVATAHTLCQMSVEGPRHIAGYSHGAMRVSCGRPGSVLMQAHAAQTPGGMHTLALQRNWGSFAPSVIAHVSVFRFAGGCSTSLNRACRDRHPCQCINRVCAI